MRAVWRQFPIVFTLPFIAATLAVERLALVGEWARWGVLFLGALAAVAGMLRRGPIGPKYLGYGDIWFLGFLGLFLASCKWSIDPSYSLQRTVSVVLLYLTCFFTLWRYANRYSEDELCGKLLYTLAALLGLNLVLGLYFDPRNLVSTRFNGYFQNPNNIGLIVALCIPLSLGRAVHSRRKGLDWIVFFSFCASLIACGSRSAMVSAAAGLLVIVTVGMIRRRAGAVLAGFVIIVAAVLFARTQYFEERVLRADTLETFATRTEFWHLATEDYIPERPRLGHGFGTDGLIHEYYDVSLRKLGLRGYGVMSSYLGLAVQIGIGPAVLFFVLIWGAVALAFISRYRDWYVVTYGATVVAGLVVCINESALYSAGNCFSFLFWTVFMLLLRRARYGHRIPAKTRGQAVKLATVTVQAATR